MKVVVIGANGQLGSDLCQELGTSNLVPLLHSDIEITDMDSIKAAFEKHQPDVVINTAAYHQPDQCEDNPDKAYLINSLGVRNLAVAAQEYGIRLAYISSDYVFGGDERRSVPYTEFDSPSPLNIVGKSKLIGEEFSQHLCTRHFIIRVSGLFGVRGSSVKGGNFIETILRIARERGEIRVVNDQIFSPTYTRDAARKIAQLVSTNYYGVFHITNRGQCSWYELAVEAIKLVALEVHCLPITSEQYPQKAKRPHFSVLDNYHLRLLGMDDMRSWQESLKAYLNEKGHLVHR